MTMIPKTHVFRILLLLPLAAIVVVMELVSLKMNVSDRSLSLATQDPALMDAPTSTTNTIKKMKPRKLPAFTETGGLVVFLHVAKTGGTSIRKDFETMAKVKRVLDEKQLSGEAAAKIDWHLSKENTVNQTMLLELHGGHGEPMTIFQIHPYLQKWKSQAAANNKQVFVFTLLREPVSFHVSYFNFFRHPNCKSAWCETPLMEITEENLLTSMIGNHQCQYLARPYNNDVNTAVPVSQHECEAVYEILKSDLDWIGTTEDMQDITLPLLSFMLSGNAEAGRKMKVQNHRRGKLSRHSLQETSVSRIRLASRYDQYLYERARSEYTLAMWENFQAATPPN